MLLGGRIPQPCGGASAAPTEARSTSQRHSRLRLTECTSWHSLCTEHAHDQAHQRLSPPSSHGQPRKRPRRQLPGDQVCHQLLLTGGLPPGDLGLGRGGGGAPAVGAHGPNPDLGSPGPLRCSWNLLVGRRWAHERADPPPWGRRWDWGCSTCANGGATMTQSHSVVCA